MRKKFPRKIFILSINLVGYKNNGWAGTVAIHLLLSLAHYLLIEGLNVIENPFVLNL